MPAEPSPGGTGGCRHFGPPQGCLKAPQGRQGLRWRGSPCVPAWNKYFCLLINKMDSGLRTGRLRQPEENPFFLTNVGLKERDAEALSMSCLSLHTSLIRLIILFPRISNSQDCRAEGTWC